MRCKLHELRQKKLFTANLNKRCTKVKQSKVGVTFWLVDKVNDHSDEEESVKV